MTASTAYTFTWTIANACNTSSSTVVLTTTGTQGPVKANAGIDQCQSSGTTSITFAGNNPGGLGTGTWTKLSGSTCTITNSSLYNSGVTGMTNGTYYFGWAINYNGCTGSIPDTMIVTISAAATTSNAGSAQTICGNSATMAANTPSVGIGSWRFMTGPSVPIIADTTSATTTVTGLIDGTYDLRWTISNGVCASNFTEVLLNIGTAPTTASAGANQNICSPTTTATLAGNTITVGSGVWSVVSGPNNPTFSNITSPTSSVSGMQMGTYTFRWSSQNGPYCAATTSDMQLTYAVTATTLTTQNLCNQTTSTLAGLPATSIGTWTWVSGPNTPTITNNGGSIANVDGMIVGTYVFQYTINDGHCGSSSKTITINNNAQPTAANAGGDQQACNAANVSIVGNTPTVGTGKWSLISGSGSFGNVNNASTTFTGTGSSILQWTVTNGTGCTTADQIRIDNYALPTTAIAGSKQNICGFSTSFAGNTPTTGVGNWALVSKPSGASDPVITAPISPTSSVSFTNIGTYIFSWTISNGICTSSTKNDTIVINGNPPTTPIAGSPQSLCNVTSTNLAGNVISPGLGTWSKVSGPITDTIADVNSPTSNISGLIPGVYDFRWTATNGSCPSYYDDVLITIYAPPTTSIAGTDQTVCNYTTINLAGNTPSNGTGLWSQISGPNTATFSDATSPTATLLGTIVGTYQLQWTITNTGGCSPSTSTVNITINDLPSLSVPGISQDVCNLTSVTLAGNTPSVGTGTWTLVSGPNTPTITSPNSANSSVTSLINGTYIFRWTIANGLCTSSNTTQVQNDAPATVANAGITQSFCSLTSATMAANTATSGTGLWTKVSGTGSPVITTPSSPTTTITGLSTGTYIYKWTITNGACTSNNNVTITNFSNPTVTAGGGTICTGSSQNITASGAISYAWSNSLGSGNTKTVSPTTSTTYIVTGTDGNNCNNTANAVVTVNSLPTVTTGGGTICIGLSQNITASGATSYAWSNSLGSGNTKTVSPTTSTTYTVTGTDGNNCSNTANAIVTVNSLPTVTSGGGTICIGTSQNITASGATSYAWSNSLGSGNTKTVSPTTSITYTVTGTDGNNCSNTANAVVTVNSLPTVTTGGGSICLGASKNITASGATTYAWSNSLGSGNTKTVSPTTSTTYLVSGTDDNNCSNTANAVVTVNSNPTANAGKKQITCPGVSLTINATGGETYSWSHGSNSASAVVTPTATSTYTVTVSTSTNCTATSSVVVIVATTLYSNNTGSWDMDNNWDATVTPAPCNDVIISSSHIVNLANLAGRCKNLTVLGTLNIDGTSSITSAGKIINGSTGIINITGSISAASYDFTAPGNTVVYNNTTVDQAVIPVKYHHLNIQNSGHTATMTSNDTVNGNLTISGALQSTNQNLFVAGDFTNNGDFTHNNGKVVFNGNTNYNGSSTTTFNKVDVTAGKLLTIQAGGKTMRVSNVIRLLATGSHNMGQLAIADNTSQLTGTGSNDSVYVQVYDTLDNWHYISAPIDSNYMGAMCYKYFYGKLYTESKGIYEWYDGKFPLIAGRGFTIRWNSTYVDPITNKPIRPADRLVTIPAKISKLHTGTITYPVTNTSGKGDGWNLVGNPYPCAIDMDAANGWLNTNIDPTVYVYDSQHQSYTTYNLTTHIGTNGGIRYIPSMQGLYVHCTANGVWSMDNRVRVAYNQPFWKGEEISTSNINQVRLLIKGNNFFDESVIAFANEATNGFDAMIDAYKLFSPEENVPQINTKTLENNSVKVALNNLPILKMYNSTVPVEITTGVAGKYTILANNLTIDPAVDVTLEDLKTKTFTDLRSSSYTFTTDAVSNENRFNVLFGARPTTIKEINTENISIYGDHKQIVIKNNSGSTEKSLVTVYDILGKQIIEKNLEPNTTSIIDMNPSNAQSIYFVKMTTENKTFTKKICITR